MKKQSVFDSGMDLGMKLNNYFLAFVAIGSLTTVIGGGMGYTYLLILGVLLTITGFAFFVVAVLVQDQKPKWQREAEQRIERMKTKK